jgi:hypothetical protein
VRRPLDHGRADERQRRVARRAHLRRAAPDGRPDHGRRAGRICAEEPRGEIYRSLRSLRDRHGPLIRERFPKLPRLVSGFPLQALLPENGFDVARALVGTEGTCVTILEATVRLVPSPPGRALLVLGFADVFEAADRTPEIMTPARSASKASTIDWSRPAGARG